MATYPGVRDFTAGDTLLASHLDELWTAFQALFPVGFIMYSVATATSAENFVNGAWLECNGVAVSRTTYSALNSLLSGLSYPFGSGNGSTTFTLPDYRGRVAISMAPSGHVDVNGLGDSDGYSTVSTRTPKHNTTSTNLTVTGAPSAGTLGLTSNGALTAGTGIASGTNLGTTSNPITGAPGVGSLDVGGSGGPGGTRPDDVVPYLVGGTYFIKAVT